MKLIFTLILFLLINLAHSQEIVQSIGLRAGGGSGFAYKYIEDFNYAFEGIINYRDNGFQATGLWERYKPFMSDRIGNFYYFWGLGAHAGYIRAKEQFCVQQSDGCVFSETKRTRVIGGMSISFILYQWLLAWITNLMLSFLVKTFSG